MVKIVLIGAGSSQFGLGTVSDIFKSETLKNCNITLHEPYVRYWEEKKINVDNSLEKILDKKVYDIIIITTGHTDYKYLVNKFMSLEKVIIYDTIGIYSEKEIYKIKTKHIIKIIGRGDI